MDDRETRKLVRELAYALLNTVDDLQSLQDVFDEDSYAKEMQLYNRAIEWLFERNEILNPGNLEK